MIRLVLIAWLALCSVAQAQLSGGVGGFPGPGMVHSAGGGCTEATNFIARTSGLNGAHQTNYTNLICGLVTDGIFSKLDVLYIFATDTTTNALLNLKSSSFNGTVVGALTFTADTGYTGTGPTNYINTGFNPFSAGGNYSQNSGSMGIYDRTSRTSQTNEEAMGTQSGAGYSFFAALSFSANLSYAINSSSPSAFANTNSQGQWIFSRTGASAIALQKNGAATTSDTISSVGPDNSNVYIFATNTGSPAAFTTDQLSAALVGGGLTGTEMTNLAARINTYMTAYSINVY